MDSRHLYLRHDTSGHRRHVECEYSHEQPSSTDTTTSTTSGSITSCLARTTSDGRQLRRQQLHAPPWTGPSATSKERKAKARAIQQQLRQLQLHYSRCNSYYNQQQHQSQNGKGKGKGPIGSYDANNNIKGKNNQKGDKGNNKGKGKPTSMTSSTKCWICGKLGHRAASCWLNNKKNVNNIKHKQVPPQHQQFQLEGTSDQPIPHMPPEGITTFNFQQLPHQQQPQIQYHQIRQALPSTTSASSTTRVSTPRPAIYDVSSINNEDICEGEHPPGIRKHHHIFNINGWSTN